MSSEPPQNNTAAVTPDEPIRFRPGKKRKAYRNRENDSPPAVESTTTQRADNLSDDDAVERTSTAAALRLRNARKARAGGVGFTATGSTSGRALDATSNALIAHTSEEGDHAVVQGIANRFTHQTGLLSSLNDKHMTEYIESRLSHRSVPPTASQADEQQTADSHKPSSTSTGATAADGAKSSSTVDPTVEQPTRHGRLMEVDLSEVPTRRRQQQQYDIAPAPKKQRLGPDGKPWRGRKRRASDDVKRDELVEAFLHENRLDVYDTTETENPIAGSDLRDGDIDGATADDRLAEQFQRQYMDDMARRRQRKKPAQPAAAPGQGEDVLKGPKLGGSRNARAAVRDALLKKEKEGRK